jgi:hypothetical protein
MANKYSSIDLSKYRNGYKKSKEVLQADAMKRASEIALKNHGDFTYKNQAMYDDVLDSLLNRKAFSYDLNGDALYQQYKNQYAGLGKLAMEDTMGQAAALTGGYGNSYAVTAGSQAYQSWLDKANEMIPEFYGMALNTYNAEGDRLANNFGVISADRNTAYGEHMDKYNQLVADRDYYANDYNNAYNRDYGQWADNRDYDTNQYWNEVNTNYQMERDAVADQQWQKQYDESVRQYNNSIENARAQAQAEVDAIKKQYEGYISPEMQKAANSEQTSLFKASVMTKGEFVRRSKNGIEVNGKTMRFDDYTQYIDAVLESWYPSKLSANEVAYLKGYYGIE